MGDKLLGWLIVGLIGVALVGGVYQAVTEGDVHAGNLLARGTPAPPFTGYRHSDRRAITSGDWKGRVLVLDFWATWCPPCRDEAPVIRDLTREMEGKGVEVIAADQDTQAEDPVPVVGRFLAEQHLEGYPVVYPAQGVSELYRVEALPTLYVIGRDGKVRFANTGFTSARRLRAEIEKALAESPPAPGAPPG